MMDPKAAAKAKRSHTQKGRRSNLSPAAISQKKKAAQAVSEEKVRRSHSYAIPSNWDRYDSGEEESKSAAGFRPAEGEVEAAPKSKGADYGHLIEQAQSQQQNRREAAELESSSLLFDEQPTDFMQGVSPMFSLRGKNLLCQCEDDNFIIDLDLISSYEVPYLTLDLHALAAKLSKLKVSKRLFIGEDLLPEDFVNVSDELNESSSSAQSEKPEVPVLAQNLDTPHSTHYSEITAIFHTDDYQNPHLPPSSPFNTTEAEESFPNITKTSTYKARDQEAELNLLLQSFSETSISGFSHFDEKPASKMSFDPSARTFDDSIDDLLAETSAASSPFEGSISSSTKDAITIDELLAETSIRAADPNFTANTNEAASSKDHSSSSGLKSTMDDFDSWIDSF